MKLAVLVVLLTVVSSSAARFSSQVPSPVIPATTSLDISGKAIQEALDHIHDLRFPPHPTGGKHSDERFIDEEHELKKMAIKVEELKVDEAKGVDTTASRHQIQEQLQKANERIEAVEKDIRGPELIRGVNDRPLERYHNKPDGGFEPLYGDHDHGVVEPAHVDHYNTHKVDSYGKVVNEVESFAHDVANDVKSEMQTKTIRSKKAKLDINQKVYIENAAVLGDSAGEASLNVCRAFTAAHVDNPAAPTVKVCGTGIKATVYMRGRCEEYYTHQQVIGKCDSGAPASTCDEFSPAQAAAFGAYQSYKIEQC